MGYCDARGSEGWFPGGWIKSLSERADERIRRLGGRLMPGKKCLGFRSGEGKKLLIGSFVAAKEAVAFLRREIEPIEKRPIPVRRVAGACLVDRISVLTHHPNTVRELPFNR